MTVTIRKLITNSLLVIASLAFSLVIGEVVVRLLFKDQVALNPRYHTDYNHGRYKLRGIRPNADFWHTSLDGSWHFVTNNQGFRNDRDFPYEKPADTARVLSLGDSHTQGYEVRQSATYSAVLERYLTAHGKPAEVLNAGVSGFSTAEALAFLENAGYKYQPDVVVLGFYANDFQDNMKAGLFALDDKGDLIERKYEHLPGVRIQNFIYSVPFVAWLSENSYFHSVLFNTVWIYFKSKLASEATDHLRADQREVDAGDPAFEYAESTSERHSQSEVSLATALLVRMHRFCMTRGIRLIVVDIPTRRVGPYRFTSSFPDSLLSSLEAEQIEYLHSRVFLGAFDGAAEFHVPNGTHHISEFTHMLLGAELGRRILDNIPQNTPSFPGPRVLRRVR